MNHVTNTLKLLRIPFSLLLMPLFLFAVSQTENIDASKMIISFLIIHLLVYPASNGYNSYIDRDEGSIGGLEKPPMPTDMLFYLTILMDIVAVFLAFYYIGVAFFIGILIYILVSRAYSSPLIRLKKYPIGGFLTVMFFQGAFTYWMAVVGITGNVPHFSNSLLFILIACSFQIAGAYPLTQIYQHQQDLDDDVITLSYKLGYRGTFLFTASQFLLSNIFYFLYFRTIERPHDFFVLALFFLPIIVYFVYWFSLVWNHNNEANFKNTMRMNLIAAICMNGCFSFLIYIKYFL